MLETGGLRLDLDTREVSFDGRELDLTAREFDLLAFLMHAPGRVFTREQIYEGVWGYSYLGDSKVIDYFVSTLRRKLERRPRRSADPHRARRRLHGQAVSIRTRLALLFAATMTLLVIATCVHRPTWSSARASGRRHAATRPALAQTRGRGRGPR